jgi:hypothetical protein
MRRCLWLPLIAISFTNQATQAEQTSIPLALVSSESCDKKLNRHDPWCIERLEDQGEKAKRRQSGPRMSVLLTATMCKEEIYTWGF